MLRSVLVLALLAPIAAGAATPAPAVSAAASPSPAPKTQHSVTGRVFAVDLQKNTILVDAPNRGRLSVTVMPTTSIQGKDPGYYAITDLKAGQHVQMYLSGSDTIVAQIIHILP